MAQTAYSINIPAVSYPGQIADDSPKRFITGIAYLAGLIYGTLAVADETNMGTFENITAKVPALTTDISAQGSALGIVTADQARAQDPSVVNPTYPQYSGVPLMRQGRIWVLAETAMADGSNPFIRFTANGALFPGSFRNDADSGKAVQLPAGQAVVRGTTLAAGYCVIDINLP